MRRPAMEKPQKSALDCWKQKYAARFKNAGMGPKKRKCLSAALDGWQVFQVIDNFLCIW